jgi:hypothetical protein
MPLEEAVESSQWNSIYNVLLSHLVSNEEYLHFDPKSREKIWGKISWAELELPDQGKSK